MSWLTANFSVARRLSTIRQDCLYQELFRMACCAKELMLFGMMITL